MECRGGINGIGKREEKLVDVNEGKTFVESRNEQGSEERSRKPEEEERASKEATDAVQNKTEHNETRGRHNKDRDDNARSRKT